MSIERVSITRVKYIALDIANIIRELMRCYGYAEEGKLDTILVRFPLEVKRPLEKLEREVGARLNKCWEAYDTVLKWCRERGYEPTKFALLDFATVLCVEPYEKLK